MNDDLIRNGVCGLPLSDNPDDRPPAYEEDPSFYEYAEPCVVEETSLGGGFICVKCGPECECVTCLVQPGEPA
jgi:hypothetical protein